MSVYTPKHLAKPSNVERFKKDGQFAKLACQMCGDYQASKIGCLSNCDKCITKVG